jgi:hypothetical protein
MTKRPSETVTMPSPSPWKFHSKRSGVTIYDANGRVVCNLPFPERHNEERITIQISNASLITEAVNGRI